MINKPNTYSKGVQKTVSIANTNRDNLQEYSMIELAMIVLEKTNKALNYREIYDQVSDLKGFTEKEKQTKLALFYTDLNLDGRFLTLGAGEWGLKKWYSVEQIDEIIQTETAPVKRKKKKKVKEKENLEPSIDDPEDDDDLTEVPLDIVGAAYKNTVTDEEDEDAITLGDDLIDEDDFDDEDYDDEDDDLDDEEDDDEDEM